MKTIKAISSALAVALSTPSKAEITSNSIDGLVSSVRECISTKLPQDSRGKMVFYAKPGIAVSVDDKAETVELYTFNNNKRRWELVEKGPRNQEEGYNSAVFIDEIEGVSELCSDARSDILMISLDNYSKFVEPKSASLKKGLMSLQQVVKNK